MGERKSRRMTRIKTKAAAAHLCADATVKNGKLAPSAVTLFERLREAVFRFIMLCAFSKPTNHHHHHHPAGDGFPAAAAGEVIKRRHFYQNADHHSEAVADCIEFIKKKAYSDDQVMIQGH